MGPSEGAYLAGAKRDRPAWPEPGDDNARGIALARWRTLIELCPEGTLVGRPLAAAALAPAAESRIAMIVTDVFEHKSTATLAARGGALMMFARWLIVSYPAVPLFPLDEESCYAYICELRAAKAPATRASRFREAIAFAFGLLHFEGGELLMASRRLAGAALGAYKNKARTRHWFCNDRLSPRSSSRPLSSQRWSCEGRIRSTPATCAS